MFNIVRILMLCRKPIPISHVYAKQTHITVIFYGYINLLEKEGLITVNRIGKRRKNIAITDKGRSLIKQWIELNKLVGVKIDSYV